MSEPAWAQEKDAWGQSRGRYSFRRRKGWCCHHCGGMFRGITSLLKHQEDVMDREMQRALEADGEKLRQLTGEDHGPFYVTSPVTELLQCPFCGEINADYCYSNAHGEVASTWVACNCGASGESVKGHDEIGAMRAWNTRPGNEALFRGVASIWSSYEKELREVMGHFNYNAVAERIRTADPKSAEPATTLPSTHRAPERGAKR